MTNGRIFLFDICSLYKQRVTNGSNSTNLLAMLPSLVLWHRECEEHEAVMSWENIHLFGIRSLVRYRSVV